jgi:hypothetical protein
MANRFIPYVPKPTNEKYSSKPLCKNVPKQPSTVDSSGQIKRNSVPIRASAVDSDVPTQKVNGDNGIMVGGTLTLHISSCLILIHVESLTGIFKSGDNGNEDVYDSEFPPVPEVVSNYWKEQRVKRGLSRGCESEVDELAPDEGSNSINSNKLVSGLNLGDSQGRCAKSAPS